MTHPHAPAQAGSRRAARARRALALFLLSWLNLALQPCLAAAPSLPRAGVRCDHGGTMQDPAPCPEMQATTCSADHDFSTDVLRLPPASRTDAQFAWPPMPAPTLAAAAPGDRRATGPPLTVRFCSFNN